VGYDLNGTRLGVDTLTLDRVFVFGTSRTLTLQKAFVINPSTTPVIDIYTLLEDDMRPVNDTMTRTPTVLTSPEVNFGDVNGVLMTDLPHLLDAGSGHKAYLWNDGSTAQTFNVNADGTYSVKVTGQNDCQVTKVVYVNPETALDDISGAGLEVVVYPNPSQGLFNLDIQTEKPEEMRIAIISSSGQVLYNQMIEPLQAMPYQVDLTRYPEGVYQLLISGKELIYRGKVVVY
jgi:hypothetical protein